MSRGTRLDGVAIFAVPAGVHMEIRETNCPLSPFVLNHDQIDHQINWVLSGHDRAYLAFAPNAGGRVRSICFEGPANPDANQNSVRYQHPRKLFKRPSHLERMFVTLSDSARRFEGERLWRMQV